MHQNAQNCMLIFKKFSPYYGGTTAPLPDPTLLGAPSLRASLGAFGPSIVVPVSTNRHTNPTWRHWRYLKSGELYCCDATDDVHRQSAGCLPRTLYWNHCWIHRVSQGQGKQSHSMCAVHGPYYIPPSSSFP